MSSWIERNQLAASGQNAIEGRYDLDGNLVEKVYRQSWAAGKKYPLIEMPSGLSREWLMQPDPRVHIFGAVDLPYHSGRDEAYKAATAAQDQYSIPFEVATEGDNGLVLVNSLSKRGYRVVYDNTGRQMTDITRFPQEAMELLPDELRAVLPPIYTNEQVGMEAVAPLKFFTAAGSWTWYATEYDGDDTCFGLVSGFEIELGYFSISELESVRDQLGLPIERDLYYTPMTLKEIQAYERKNRGE